MSNSTRCYHCNNPVPEQINLSIQVGDNNFPVCCTGCQAVAQLVLGGGFSQFYQFRDTNLSVPQQLTPEDEEQISLFDRDDLLQKITRRSKPADSESSQSQFSRLRMELVIDGITCAACVWLIEQFIKQLPGVDEFWVNLSTHRAELVWRQSITPLSKILTAIQQLGFKALPYSPDAEEQRLRQQQRTTLLRLGIAGIGMMQNMMFAAPMYFGIELDSARFITLFRYVSLLVACPVVLYSATPFFSAALRDLRAVHLTMDVPVSIAIGGAFIASAWVTLFGGEEVYFDSVCMFTFFLLLGRYLESRARASAVRGNNRLRATGNTFIRRIEPGDHKTGTLIPSEQLVSGNLIELKPGSLIPVDGLIVEGQTEINAAALTGEFAPQKKQVNDIVLSGSVNIKNKIIVKVTAVGEQSHLSTINRLVDRALKERPRLSTLADKVASYFVAGVLLAASLIALVWWQLSPDDAFSVTLAVLVATCPCALSLATPTALTVATTALRDAGFVITRGQVIETLASTNHFVFDKTGTLTRGQLTIEKTENYSNFSDDKLTEIAAALEADSHHPIARVFKPFAKNAASEIRQVPGFGVTGKINKAIFRLGRREFVLQQQIIPLPDIPAHNSLQQVYLANDHQLLAIFHLSDVLRPSAHTMADKLNSQHKTLSILSGDSSALVEQTATELGINSYFKGLSPRQKLDQVKIWQQQGQSLTMIGDGINDVPVMAGANLSIAMNNASDLTQLKADAIILNGDLNTLSYAIEKAQATTRIIRQNIFWAIGYNLTVLPLAAAGLVAPYAAAIGMSASSLLVVFNALRLSKAPVREKTFTPE